MQNIEIRPAIKSDLPSLVSIENSSFLAPWKESDLLYELEDNPVSEFLVLEIDSKVVGFIDYWITFDSATLAQVTIDVAYRGNHLSNLLMEEMIKTCHAKKCIYITLEVRTHNTSAINLYEKFKFVKTITKPHYYTNGDDAYYMIRKVD